MESDSGLFVLKTFQASRKSDSQKSREAELPVGRQRWESVTVVTVPPSQLGKRTENAAQQVILYGVGGERACGVILQVQV